jgi:hypothetical protein
VKTRQKRRRPKVPSSFYFLRVVVVIPHDSKEMEGRSHEMKTTIVLHYVAERERRRCKNAAFGSASRTGHQPNTERVRREKGRETRGGWITELEISWGQVFKRE